jgi:hypothetical protein
MLRPDPNLWLLEEKDPSVRYFVLRDIIKADAQKLKNAKTAIKNSKIITRIDSKQNPDGSWGDPDSPYLPKYKSSYWTVMLLASLGMDRSDPRIAKACEHLFRFQHRDGGFMSASKKNLEREYKWRARRGRDLPPFEEWLKKMLYEQQSSCLTGNMTAALIRFGYENDPHIEKALGWLVKVQNRDGGWLCPYWSAHAKDTHGCFYGTICPLEAFSELPQNKLTTAIKKTIQRGAEFLLMHRLFKADHHGFSVINRHWLQFSYPWFYGYNILRGLDVLTKLGYGKDERMKDALQIVKQKRQRDGTWSLDNTPSGRMQANIGTKAMPSKWITLIALRVLSRV